MGCGGSATRNEELREAIKDSEVQDGRLTQQLQDKNRELQSFRQNEAEAQAQAHPAELYIVVLREKLQARQSACRAEVQQRKIEQEREYEQLQHKAQEENERRPQSSSSRTSPDRPAHSSSPTGQQSSERDYVRQLEAAAARRHHEEAESIEKQLQALREQMAPLQEEHCKATQDLVEALQQNRAQQEGHKSSASVNSSLEDRLTEKRSEHARAEQRFDDLERHLKDQMKELRGELHLRSNELRARDKHLQERDKELGQVNGQLADLQNLFDDVNQQLQTECGRIEQLQETVALCAKQGKELEALQGMLEESHRVLTQMRDALESERIERSKAAELLEHEQQRTQLLLDVLKHFKEKLQGLTPQMLLSRLGAGAGSDSISKALLGNGVAAANSCSNGAAVGGNHTPSHHLQNMQGAKGGGGSQEAASRAFVGGNQGGFTGSPRRPASDGLASTIAPETSSVAHWGLGTGGSAVPSPGYVPPATNVPQLAWPFPVLAQIPPRGPPAGHGAAETLYSAPPSGPVYYMGQWEMGGEPGLADGHAHQAPVKAGY